MKLKYIPYLLWNSIKAIGQDLVDFLAIFKKASTWSFMLYGIIILMVFYRVQEKSYWIAALVPTLLIYFMRRSHETDFQIELKRKIFLKNDLKEVMPYYEKYKKDCYYKKIKPLDYNQYYQQEREKILEQPNHQASIQID